MSSVATARVVDLINESVFDCVKTFLDYKGRTRYECIEDISYYSKRYKKWIIRKAGDVSDGATYAKDIDSFSWLFHDDLCDTGTWADGEPCTNWQGSNVCSDILSAEGYTVRKHTWFLATWLFGGKKLRKNGMW